MPRRYAYVGPPGSRSSGEQLRVLPGDPPGDDHRSCHGADGDDGRHHGRHRHRGRRTGLSRNAGLDVPSFWGGRTRNVTSTIVSRRSPCLDAAAQRAGDRTGAPPRGPGAQQRHRCTCVSADFVAGSPRDDLPGPRRAARRTGHPRVLADSGPFRSRRNSRWARRRWRRTCANQGCARSGHGGWPRPPIGPLAGRPCRTRTRRPPVSRSERQRVGRREVRQAAEVEVHQGGSGEEGAGQAERGDTAARTAVDRHDVGTEVDDRHRTDHRQELNTALPCGPFCPP